MNKDKIGFIALSLFALLLMVISYFVFTVWRARATKAEIEFVFSLFLFLIFLLAFIAWMFAIRLFVGIVKQKGYSNKFGVLWFIGLFATPLAVGLYAIALPDKNDVDARSTPVATSSGAESGPADLPSL